MTCQYHVTITISYFLQLISNHSAFLNLGPTEEGVHLGQIGHSRVNNWGREHGGPLFTRFSENHLMSCERRRKGFPVVVVVWRPWGITTPQPPTIPEDSPGTTNGTRSTKPPWATAPAPSLVPPKRWLRGTHHPTLSFSFTCAKCTAASGQWDTCHKRRKEQRNRRGCFNTLKTGCCLCCQQHPQERILRGIASKSEWQGGVPRASTHSRVGSGFWACQEEAGGEQHQRMHFHCNAKKNALGSGEQC